jgi:tetratricopeptide (TPR) repeat protein
MQRSLALVAALALGIPALASPQSAPADPPIPPSAQQEISPELRGDLAMARQQYVAAIADYAEAPADSPDVWDKRGMAWHHLFALNKARSDYLHALRLRPDFPEALNNLGAVYFAKKDYRRAVKYYRKSLALDPRSAAVLNNLGAAYFAEGKDDLGIEAFHAAFALNPRIFDTPYAVMVPQTLSAGDRAQQDFCLAKLFASSGRNSEAIDYLRKAFNEGFDDRQKLLDDQTLASLRATPEFALLMTEQKAP